LQRLVVEADAASIFSPAHMGFCICRIDYDRFLQECPCFGVTVLLCKNNGEKKHRLDRGDGFEPWAQKRFRIDQMAAV